MSAVVLRDPATRRIVVLRGERATPNVLVHGFRGPPGPKGTGEPGPAGQSFQLSGAVGSYSELPNNLTPDDAGKAWLTNADGRVYVWSGGAWPAEGEAPVLQGPPGSDGAPGQVRFTGHGPPPAVIVGANPQDTYMDLDDGTLYKLA